MYNFFHLLINTLLKEGLRIRRFHWIQSTVSIGLSNQSAVFTPKECNSLRFLKDSIAFIEHSEQYVASRLKNLIC